MGSQVFTEEVRAASWPAVERTYAPQLLVYSLLQIATHAAHRIANTL